MIRFSMWRQLAATCISVVSVSVYACSAADAPPGSSESANTQGEELEIQFPKMYSTYAPGHEAKVPAIVTGVKKVQWSVSDRELADIETQSDGSAIITVRKAGTVTIKAKAGSLTGEARLVITEAKEGEWEAGDARYNNGKVYKRPEGKRDGNCGTSCHTGTSTATAFGTGLRMRIGWDELAGKPPAEWEMVKSMVGVPVKSPKWVGEPRITPGDPEASVVRRLLGKRGAEQMPPIATRVVDVAGKSAVELWISSMASKTIALPPIEEPPPAE